MIVPASATDITYEPPRQPQSLTIPTPNGLSAVPVSSGGNYTDENGQQYVSDYKDYERMVYVQNVGKLTAVIASFGVINDSLTYGVVNGLFDKVPKFDNMLLCDRAVYKKSANLEVGCVCENKDSITFIGSAEDTLETMKAKYDGSTIYYQLAEPIETPLSEEEIAAYKALHTYKPNTTIYNSEGADMEVKYVADTKLYIDNKIEKAVAELSAAIITE